MAATAASAADPPAAEGAQAHLGGGWVPGGDACGHASPLAGLECLAIAGQP